MMYMPSEKIRKYANEAIEWMYFDKEEQVPKLREDAPKDIVEKWEEVLADYKHNGEIY